MAAPLDRTGHLRLTPALAVLLLTYRVIQDSLGLVAELVPGDS